MQIRNRRLGRDDFNQSTLKVAKALIGKGAKIIMNYVGGMLGSAAKSFVSGART